MLKSIKQAKNLTNKKVLLRTDFNVPLSISHKQIKIADDYKILSSLPTIRFLLKKKCKIIIATHIESLKLKTNNSKLIKELVCHSTELIAKRLSKLLNCRIKFVNNCIGPIVEKAINGMKEKEILLLENLRFHKEEKQNSKKFAKKLAGLTDIYVNNAFAASHRKHASIHAIQKYLPAYSGLLVEQEIKNLDKVLHPKLPLAIIMGGAKTEVKIPLIKNFCARKNQNKITIMLGGILANTFLAANNFEIGRSLIDKDAIALVKKLKKNTNIISPIDVVVKTPPQFFSLREKKGGGVKIKNINNISKNDIILDIGPETVKLYSDFIKKAQTIVWNGPMGMFEDKNFKKGTLAIAKAIAICAKKEKVFGVVGGGETIKALEMTKIFDYIDWTSTGGGAMLTYLSATHNA
ncbi:MAG: phosphoglycerate kinase [Patescibacteria group bacterium]